MRTIRYGGQFKKDFKRMQRRGNDLAKLRAVIESLTRGQALAAGLRDHPLQGKFGGARDCHVDPDWILIYAIVDDELRLFRKLRDPKGVVAEDRDGSEEGGIEESGIRQYASSSIEAPSTPCADPVIW